MAPELVLRGIFSAMFVASVLRISTPIILPALGGLITELAGATNIALEGIMLVAAFTGVLVSAYTGSVWLGVLGGILSGVLISALLAYFYLYLKTDVFLAGIAINIMATGGTIFLLYILTGDKGSSSSLASGQVPVIQIPFVQDVPFLGTVLSGHNIFTYAAFPAHVSGSALPLSHPPGIPSAGRRRKSRSGRYGGNRREENPVDRLSVERFSGFPGWLRPFHGLPDPLSAGYDRRARIHRPCGGLPGRANPPGNSSGSDRVRFCRCALEPTRLAGYPLTTCPDHPLRRNHHRPGRICASAPGARRRAVAPFSTTRVGRFSYLRRIKCSKIY